MYERLKRLYLEGKLNDEAIRKAVTDNFITPSEASIILTSNK